MVFYVPTSYSFYSLYSSLERRLIIIIVIFVERFVLFSQQISLEITSLIPSDNR